MIKLSYNRNINNCKAYNNNNNSSNNKLINKK